MHQIFHRLDKEVWRTTKSFCVPLEQERAPKPLKPTTKKLAMEEEMEKKIMPTAYVLLTTEIGAETHVLNSLKKISGVQEVYSLWGVYDIIAHVQAESMENLKQIITNRIDKIGKVNSKLTMIIQENTPSIQSQVFFEQPTVLV
jgi:DNA-binding Lrp family transcriptional regulator